MKGREEKKGREEGGERRLLYTHIPLHTSRLGQFYG